MRLIVLDSIAGLYRSHGDEPGTSRVAVAAERSRQLMHVAATLQKISDEYDVAVLVTNQITDKPLSDAGAEGVSPAEEGAYLHPGNGGRGSLSIPALGLGWSLGVNTRLVLTRREGVGLPLPPPLLMAPPPQWPEQPREPHQSTGGFARELHVIFSPRIEYRSCRFEVREEGVVGLG